MKKVLLFLSFLFLITPINAEDSLYDIIENENEIFYSQINNTWSINKSSDEDLVLFKNSFDGAGSYSTYKFSDGSLAFALATNCELIKDGKLIIIDNNLLKYYELQYNNKNIKQIELSESELKNIFPDTEIFKISQIDNDDKIWLHKPLLKKRTILLLNDTNRFFHQINCKSKNVQDNEIKGLITFNRYGSFTFKHFGKRNGKLIFYIR